MAQLPQTLASQSLLVSARGQVSLLTEATGSAISLWGSIGFVALGALAAGFVLLVAFRIPSWVASCFSSTGDSKSQENTETEEPLLAKRDCEKAGGCWQSSPSLDYKQASTEQPAAAGSWGLLITSALVAIPSILGSWCWPLLLVVLFGASPSVADDDSREATHHATLGADLVLFSAAIFYVWRSCASTSGRAVMKSSLARWGPLVLVCLGSILLLLDPLRHVLLDHGGVFFKEESLAMYAGQGRLSTIGQFCRNSSIMGMISLMLGILWYLRLPEALVAKCLPETTSL